MSRPVSQAPLGSIRPIDWDPAGGVSDGCIRLLDQTRLPHELIFLDVTGVDQLIEAIRRLAVRGAPALGVAGALGVALAVRTLPPDGAAEAITRLRTARPTAVNLARGVDLAASAIERTAAGPEREAAVLAVALGLRDAEIAASTAMARRGADELYRVLPDRSLRLLTICNTGALAAVEHGTALAVAEQVWRDGRLERVIACETRPLLQGARLTAWELSRLGVPFDLIVDAAAASLVARGLVDAVLVGADRIAANGDTANKVGTFALALAARYARPDADGGPVPFFVVAPETTLDATTPDGAAIVIEDRGRDEVVALHGVRIAPDGATALNPAFDVTPADLITGIVTDQRIIRPEPR
ncbi:MAG: S-methyl-5-thioribose-1-phosphate isomerase [Kineosporiaceae bacterium]